MYDCSMLITVHWRRKSKDLKVLIGNDEVKKELRRENGQSWFVK